MRSTFPLRFDAIGIHSASRCRETAAPKKSERKEQTNRNVSRKLRREPPSEGQGRNSYWKILKLFLICWGIRIFPFAGIRAERAACGRCGEHECGVDRKQYQRRAAVLCIVRELIDGHPIRNALASGAYKH